MASREIDENTGPRPKERRSRPWRILRGLLLFLGGLGALVLLLAVGLAVFLSTDYGKRFVVRKGLEAADDAIPGQVRLKGAEIRWTGLIDLTGLSLLTPEGEPVITVDRLLVRYRLADLLRGLVNIDQLRIEHPVVSLRYDEEGRLNLERALPPPKEPPPDQEPWDGRLPLDVDADRIEIERGELSLVDARAADAVKVAFEGLRLDASYHHLDRRHDLAIEPLALNLTAPAVGEARLEARGTYSMLEGEEVIRLDTLWARAPGLELSGSGQLIDFQAPRGDLELRADQVAASFLRVFAPDLPIEGQAALRLTAKGDGRENVVVDGVVELPRGVITLAGTIDPSGREQGVAVPAYDLRLTAHEVALDPLLTLETPPLSPLSFRLTTRGRGLTPATMDTQVRLEIDPLTYERHPFQGGTITGQIRKNVITLEQSRIDSPYARLFAEGTLDLEGVVDVRARAEVDQLERLGELIDVPVRGQATLVATALGDFQAPDIDYRIDARQLAYGQPGREVARLRSLEAKGDVVLARTREGRIDPRVRTVATGDDLGASEVFLDRFTLTASWQEPVAKARLDAVDARGRPVELGASAQVGDERQVVQVAHLVAPLGSTSWRLRDDFTVTASPGRVHLTPFVIAGADGQVSGGGTYTRSGRNDLELMARNLNLSNFAPMMPERLARLRGGVDLNAGLEGPATAPEVTALVELRGVSARSIPEVSGNVRLTTVGAAGARTALSTDLVFRDGGVIVTRLNLPVPLTLRGVPSVPDDASLGGLVRLQNTNLAILAALGGEGMEHLSGRLDAYLRLEGTRSDPRLQLDLVGDDLTLRSDREIDADARLTFAGQRLRLTGNITNPEVRDQTLIAARIDLPLEITRELEIRPDFEGEIDGSIRIDAREARSLAPLLPELERVRGLVALDFAATGSLGAPVVKAQLRGRQIQVQAYPSTDLDLELAYGEGTAAALTRVVVAGQQPALGEARVRMPLGQALRGGALPLSDLRAAVRIDAFDLMTLPPVIRGPQLRSGKLTVNGTFESVGPVPKLELTGSLDDLSVARQEELTVALSGALREDALRLVARITEGQNLQADISGLIPVELRLPLEGRETRVAFRPGLDVRANIPGLDISLANAFLPNRASVDGKLRGRATLAGALNAPDIRGTLELQRGEIYLPSEGVYYDRVHLLTRFTQEEIVLEELRARGGRGRLEMAGTLRMEDGRPGQIEATARFDRFEAMDGPRGRAVVHGNLQAGGDVQAPSVRGELTVREAVLKLPDITSSVIRQVAGLEPGKQLAPRELPPNVSVLTRRGLVPWKEYTTGEAARPVEEEAGLAYDADIKIHVPRDFWIQNEAQEIVAEVKGDVTFLAEDGVPRMVGEVETLRGEIRLFTEELEITEGTITFIGGPEINPRLDINAVARTTEYGEVGLRVTGAARSPELEFFSEEGYETADVLSILIIGKPLSEANPREGQQLDQRLESIAAGALSGWVRRQLAGRLPIDYLRIEATSFTSFDLRVGKYVTPRLFIVYRRRIGESEINDQNVNEARAEYQIGRNFYVETFYGDANVWGGELFWRRFY